MRANTYGIISTKPGTAHPLTPVLETWIKVQKRYFKIEGEPAYHHSEVANNSLLVAAATQHSGWTGIAEYYVERQKENTTVGNGLSDVYLANKDRGFSLETKQFWVRSSELENSIFSKNNETKLETAKSQILSLDTEDSHTRWREQDTLWGGFIVPNISIQKIEDLNDERSQRIRSKALMLARKYFGLIAYYFPPVDVEYLRDWDYPFQPGVVLGLNDSRWTEAKDNKASSGNKS